MRQAELAAWLRRFEHASAVWKAKGLTGESAESSLLQGFELYRGSMAAHWPEGLWSEFGAERVIANSVFDTVNTLDAQLNARAPRVLLFPQTPESGATARLAEAALNYYVRELDLVRPMSRAVRDSFFAPIGVVTHGYSPPSEAATRRGRASEADLPLRNVPWIRREAIWNVRIDPTGESLHPAEARWFARRRLYRLDEVQAHPSLRAPKGLRPTVSMDLERMRPRALRDQESDDWNQYVEVWFFFDRLERKWFGWSPGSDDDLILAERDWPIPWDELPYDGVAFNEQCDDPFPESYVAQIAPIQLERNRIRTMMAILVKQLRRNVLVATGLLAEGERDKIFGLGGPELHEFFDTGMNLPSAAVAQVQTGGFPQELLAYEAILKEDIRERTGQSQMDRAQRINVTSATEAAFVQQGSDTQQGRNQQAVERFWKSAIRKFGQGVRAVVDEESLVPIVGPEDARTLIEVQEGREPFLRVSPEAIRGDYLYDIRVGSTLPRSKGEDRQEAAQWLAIAERFPQSVNLVQALQDSARAWDRDPAKALLTPTEGRLADAVEEERGNPPQTPISPLAVLPGGGGGAAR